MILPFKMMPPDPIEPFRFSTKGGTLEDLAPHLTQAVLCEQIIVPVQDWRGRRDGVVEDILARFEDRPLAVRSSATDEDGVENSLAGAYLSRTDVPPTPGAIADVVDDVFASYARSSDGDQVLVQPMITDVAISGVVLTRDLDTGSPYFVVNYDDFSGRTDTVTGGAESKTILIHRARPDAVQSPRFRKLVNCIIELEQITGSDELDIEFCITGEDVVFVLQVRHLAARRQWNRPTDADIDATLDDIRVRLKERMARKPGLSGSTTILGEMPDWNPAEMIGNAPRPLALSLYKHLITDGVWAEARTRMGYRPVNEALLVDLCGRPFIDVRTSFNSFLPDGLDPDFSARLIDHQIERLRRHRQFHDKIEFEVAVTCRDFSFHRERRKLEAAGFSGDDLDRFEAALAHVTLCALKTGAGGIEDLVGQTNRLLDHKVKHGAEEPLESIRRLLEDCKAHGTLPFSQLARHGFIGVLFLKSLVHHGVFSQDDADRFMTSVHTVAADLVNDIQAVAAGNLDRESFMAGYGHLRPTTYDILSWRYDERPDLYLGHAERRSTPTHVPFKVSDEQRNVLTGLLETAGYDITADALLAYIAAAIKGREQAKFAFTRSVSDILMILGNWGRQQGLSRDDLSFLPIHAVLDEPVDGLAARVAAERDRYKMTRAIRLPHLITEPSSVDVVRLPLGHPTFITSNTVTGKPIPLSAAEVPDIDGCIVLIESADPGFDWIFSHSIVGLITKYGGANSHMAIRCAEFGLPAAIGCGERLFKSMTEAAVIELNAAARKLSPH